MCLVLGSVIKIQGDIYMTSRKVLALASVAFGALMLATAGTQTASAAECPAITVADSKGLAGKYPQQFDLAEFESAANCKLTFQENPKIGALNGKIRGNPDPPALAQTQGL